MKKLKCLLLLSALLLTSCSSPKPAETGRLYNEERVRYDINDAFRTKLYEGNVYAVSMWSEGDEVSEDSEDMPEGEKVLVFGETGEKVGEFTLKGAHVSHCWDIADGRVYSVDDMSYYSEETETYLSHRILYSSDIETGESKEICDFEGVRLVEKIRAVGDKLYWLGTKEEFEPFSDSVEQEDGVYVGYTGTGVAFGYIDLATGTFFESDIPNPVAFSERNGQVIVYAYEEGKGFYFYDYTAGSVLCRTNKLGQVSDFDIVNDELDFVFRDYISAYNGTLVFSGMDDVSGVIQLDDGLWSSCFSVEGDYLCVQASENRYSMNDTVFKYFANISTSDPPIRIVTSSERLKNEPLFSCGYQIKTDLLSNDGFALTVLSLDKDYDMAMMSSNEGYANEMKRKGSFYPLNDVPGVKEYMENCFPYIKEAATDEEGNIWMLPISVNVPSVIYNEKNCAEKDISFPAEIGAFFDEMKKAADYPKYCSCFEYDIIRSMINSYLSENDSFDTEEFRGFAPILKENRGAGIFKGYTSDVLNAFYDNMLRAENGRGLPGGVLYEEVYEKALFTVTDSLNSQTDLTGDENLRAAPVPTANGVNNAYCTFVCVNPNSEHLAETLLFIERTVSRFADRKNGFTLNDKSMYSDDPYTQSLFEIYANCEISFTMPWEIYQNDFESYINGGLELDEFIAEADRKLSAYLNE